MTRRSEAALVARRAFRGGTGAWLQLARPRIPWARYRRRVAAAVQAADSHKRRLNAVYAANLLPEIQLTPGFQSWRFNVMVPAPDRGW